MWSEFAPGSCPSVVRRVAHWVEHYRVGPRRDLEGWLRAGSWGSGARMKHTVGCLKQHRQAPVGVWLFLMALIPDMPGLFVLGVGGVGVCCLRTAQWTRASLNCFVNVSV